MDSRYLAHTFRSWGYLPYGVGWFLETIRAARTAHDQGVFASSAPLVWGLTTDPRVSAALALRSATATKFPIEVSPARADAGTGRGITSESARARAAFAAADVRVLMDPRGLAVPLAVRRHSREWAIMMGLAVSQNLWDRGRESWSLRVEPWPLSCVYVDVERWEAAVGFPLPAGAAVSRGLMAVTRDGPVPIVHGDGKWTVLAPHGPESWLRGALRCTALEWAARQYANRTASHEAHVHGMRIPLGELPDGTKTSDPEGVAFAELLTAIMKGGTVAGVHPNGAKIYGFEPGSTGHVLLEGIIRRSNADLVIAILGQDSTTQDGSVYTGPALDKVRDDLTDVDVGDEDGGYQTGVVAPFAMVNHGEDVIPTISTLLPRPEVDARAKASGERRAAHAAQLVADRAAGVDVDQPHSDAVARDLGMREPFPRLALRGPSGTAPVERAIVAA